jgi:hypothetical protein
MHPFQHPSSRRYIFEALAKVNRTDLALRMLHVTEYPSFGYQITNPMEPATSLWESYDVPTMHQWVDESSRDHHYSASINTFLRKYLGGLDQPVGGAAWKVVKCRPEAAHWPHLLGKASATLVSRRGKVGCAWEVEQAARGADSGTTDATTDTGTATGTGTGNETLSGRGRDTGVPVAPARSAEASLATAAAQTVVAHAEHQQMDPPTVQCAMTPQSTGALRGWVTCGFA